MVWEPTQRHFEIHNFPNFFLGLRTTQSLRIGIPYIIDPTEKPSTVVEEVIFTTKKKKNFHTKFICPLFPFPPSFTLQPHFNLPTYVQQKHFLLHSHTTAPEALKHTLRVEAGLDKSVCSSGGSNWKWESSNSFTENKTKKKKTKQKKNFRLGGILRFFILQKIVANCVVILFYSIGLKFFFFFL